MRTPPEEADPATILKSAPVKPEKRSRISGRLIFAAIAAGLAAAATTASAQLDIDAANGNSPYTVSATASYTTIVVGDTGTGVLNDSAYTLTATSTVMVGNVAGSNGTYNLSGTGGLTDTTATITVGNAGTGLFNQTGGTLTMTNHSMVLGNASGAAGTYTLSGGSATMLTAFIGNAAAATGTVNVSAGTLSFTGSIDDGYQGSTSSGALNISGGTVGTAINLYDGYQGTSDVKMTGGTLNVAGNFDFAHGSTGAHGTLEVATGATLNLTGTGSQFLIGEIGVGTITMTGGAITNSGTAATVVGGSTGTNGTHGNGTVNLSGGTFDASTGGLYVGDAGVGAVTQAGGTLKTGTAGVTVGVLAGSTGTYTLTAGTLSAGKVTGGAGASTLNLNGGTIQATAANTTFLQTLTTANVQTGGAVIDTNTFDLTIAQNLLHDTTGGAPALDGGLTKLSTGTLTLSGANTWTGTLNVSAGTLLGTVNGALGAGRVSVAAGANLSVSSGVTGASTPNAGSLTLVSGTTSKVTLSGTGIQDTVSALIINGITEPEGTYGAVGSGATYTNLADFFGTGELLVVPEPTTWLGGLGLLGASVLSWHRRPRAF